MDSTREEELGLENLFHCNSNIISCDIASTYGYPAHRALEDARAMKTIPPTTQPDHQLVLDYIVNSIYYQS